MSSISSTPPPKGNTAGQQNPAVPAAGCNLRVKCSSINRQKQEEFKIASITGKILEDDQGDRVKLELEILFHKEDKPRVFEVICLKNFLGENQENSEKCFKRLSKLIVLNTSYLVDKTIPTGETLVMKADGSAILRPNDKSKETKVETDKIIEGYLGMRKGEYSNVNLQEESKRLMRKLRGAEADGEERAINNVYFSYENPGALGQVGNPPLLENSTHSDSKVTVQSDKPNKNREETEPTGSENPEDATDRSVRGSDHMDMVVVSEVNTESSKELDATSDSSADEASNNPVQEQNGANTDSKKNGSRSGAEVGSINGFQASRVLEPDVSKLEDVYVTPSSESKDPPGYKS